MTFLRGVNVKEKSIAFESSTARCDLAGQAETAGRPMNEESFANFYNNTVRPLWSYLSRMSGSCSLADDLVQESYLRFLSAKAPWEAGEAACRRYLFRIGTNLLRDHWRRPANHSLEDIPERELPRVSPLRCEQLDSEAALDAALARLRPTERQLLWLAHAEGLSYREISDIMGLGIARIRLTLFRSRRKLGRLLRQREFKARVQL